MAPEVHAQATLQPGRWQPEEADPPLAPGAVIDRRYRVIRLLGEGGMGRVYEAEHLFIRRRLALKLVRRDAGTGEAAARLLQEAVLAGKVPHPTVVPVFDCAALPDGQVYVAMELLRGESLEQALARPQPAAEVLRWLAEVARGLAAAHRAGIVHRDVKPANLFLARTPEGAVQPRILDFGIAKLLPGGGDAAVEIVRTQAGALLGTPFYMAPERARGEPGGPQSDLYSFGVILYEALTGEVPFAGEQFMEIVGRHLREAPLDPRQAAPARQIPDALAELVLALLRKEPGERPGDGEAVARALLGLVAREPGLAGLRVGAPGCGDGPGEGAATRRMDGPGDRSAADAATRRMDGPGDRSAADAGGRGEVDGPGDRSKTPGSGPESVAGVPGRDGPVSADRAPTLAVGSGGLAGAPGAGRDGPVSADRAPTLAVGSGGLAGPSGRGAGVGAEAGPPDRPGAATRRLGSGGVDGGAEAGRGDSSVGRPRRGAAGPSDRASTRQVGSGQVGAAEAVQDPPRGRPLRTVALATAMLAAAGLGGWTALQWGGRTGVATVEDEGGAGGAGVDVGGARGAGGEGDAPGAGGEGGAAVPAERVGGAATRTDTVAAEAAAVPTAASEGPEPTPGGDRPVDAAVAADPAAPSQAPGGKRREPGKKAPRKAGTTATVGREQAPKIKIDVYDE